MVYGQNKRDKPMVEPHRLNYVKIIIKYQRFDYLNLQNIVDLFNFANK